MPNKFSGLLDPPPKLMNWNSATRPPYVYDRVPEDKTALVLNEKRFEALKRAVHYVEKGSSYKDAAAWLSVAANKYITRQGIFYIHKNYLADKKGRISEKRLNTAVKKSILQAIDAARQVSPSSPDKTEGQTENSSNAG